MYVLNITIPPIFVDNHVEPSKSAVNIQVGPLSVSLRGLTFHLRITRFYIPSFRQSSKSFYSKIRSPNHLLRLNHRTDRLTTRENDEGSQIIQFPFIHQNRPSNHIAPQNLIAFLQN